MSADRLLALIAIVIAVAGVALALTEPDQGLGQQDFINALQSGMDRARAAIDDGSATSVLRRWVTATRG